MGLLWVANGWLQGMGFPPCARLLTHWIPPKQLATKMSVWNTSHSIGAGLVVILCGYIMGTLGSGPNHVGAWKWCFWIPAAISFAGAIGLFHHAARYAALGGAARTARNRNQKKEKPGKKERRGETHAAPDGICQSIDLGPFDRELFRLYRALFSTGLGTVTAQTVEGHLAGDGRMARSPVRNRGNRRHDLRGLGHRPLPPKGRAHRTCVFCMAGTAVFIFGFWELPQGAPDLAHVPAAVRRGLLHLRPAGADRHRRRQPGDKKKYAATATGFTGLFGYASTIVSGTGLGYVAQHYGWNWAYITMITMALVGMLVFSLMWRAKMDGYARINS